MLYYKYKNRINQKYTIIKKLIEANGNKDRAALALGLRKGM